MKSNIEFINWFQGYLGFISQMTCRCLKVGITIENAFKHLNRVLVEEVFYERKFFYEITIKMFTLHEHKNNCAQWTQWQVLKRDIWRDLIKYIMSSARCSVKCSNQTRTWNKNVISLVKCLRTYILVYVFSKSNGAHSACRYAAKIPYRTKG